MRQVVEILYGTELSSHKLGEHGVLSIVEFEAPNTPIYYEVGFVNKPVERLYDVKRVTYSE